MVVVVAVVVGGRRGGEEDLLPPLPPNPNSSAASSKSIVSPLLLDLSPASTFGLPEPGSSKLPSVQLAIFQSTLLQPNTDWPEQRDLPPPQDQKASMIRDSRAFVLFFARCFCCHRGSYPCCMHSARSCSHHTRSQQLLDRHLHVTFLGGFILLNKLFLHFFFLAFSFAPKVLTLVLKSTPSVSTRLAIVTPPLLH